MKPTAPRPLPSSGCYQDDKLIEQAQLVADAFARAYNKKHRTKLPVPVPISFDLHLTKPKWAGGARGCKSISLNLILFRDYPDEFLNRVIPHECAHLAEVYIDSLNNAKPGDHGPRWQAMMKTMTQAPFKHHAMNTKKAMAAYKAAKKAKKG